MLSRVATIKRFAVLHYSANYIYSGALGSVISIKAGAIWRGVMNRLNQPAIFDIVIFTRVSFFP